MKQQTMAKSWHVATHSTCVPVTSSDFNPMMSFELIRDALCKSILTLQELLRELIIRLLESSYKNRNDFPRKRHKIYLHQFVDPSVSGCYILCGSIVTFCWSGRNLTNVTSLLQKEFYSRYLIGQLQDVNSSSNNGVL